MCKHYLPGFRTSCLIVAGLYSFLAGGVLLRGTRASMTPFAVPEVTLASPHYDDAIWWVYSHMLVIGLVIGVLGLYAESQKLKTRMARLLLVAHVYYTYLDARASDSFFGNGLYKGPGSVIPAIICLIMTVLFAHLSFCTETPTAPAQR